MNFYYVNDSPQKNGDHEVHKDGCQYMPKNRTFLGYHSTCNKAVEEADKKYPGKADGCAFCCPTCHKK